MMLFLNLVGANIESLPAQKVNTNIELKQVGADFTFCNITSFLYPNLSICLKDVEMTKRGNDYNYTIDKDNITILGDYIANGFCSNGTDDVVFSYLVPITPSGESGFENAIFFILVIVIFYTINLFGFFGKNIPMTILGGMALIFLGIYMITHGVIIYRDNLTNYLAYVTIGWGFISSIWAAIEAMDVL